MEKKIRNIMIPMGISDTKKIFTIFEEQVEFPGYFGRNWNAMDECLRDLTWLRDDGICLQHYDLPLMKNRSEASIYLRVIIDAANFHSVSATHKSIFIRFPIDCRKEIFSILEGTYANSIDFF